MKAKNLFGLTSIFLLSGCLIGCGNSSETTLKRKVIFDYNFVENVKKEVEVNYGELVKKDVPLISDMTFIDWYLEPECINVFDFSTPIKTDTHLYAYFSSEKIDIFAKALSVYDYNIYHPLYNSTHTKGKAYSSTDKKYFDIDADSIVGDRSIDLGVLKATINYTSNSKYFYTCAYSSSSFSDFIEKASKMEGVTDFKFTSFYKMSGHNPLLSFKLTFKNANVDCYFQNDFNNKGFINNYASKLGDIEENLLFSDYKNDSAILTVNAYYNIKDNIHSSYRVKNGDLLSTPYTPYIEGYNFLGWYTEPECINEFDFSLPITTNINLYAYWEATNPFFAFSLIDFTNVHGSSSSIYNSNHVTGSITEGSESESFDTYGFVSKFDIKEGSYVDYYPYGNDICVKERIAYTSEALYDMFSTFISMKNVHSYTFSCKVSKASNGALLLNYLCNGTSTIYGNFEVNLIFNSEGYLTYLKYAQKDTTRELYFSEYAYSQKTFNYTLNANYFSDTIPEQIYTVALGEIPNPPKLEDQVIDGVTFLFSGWYYDREMSLEMTSAVAHCDVNLFAKWVCINKEKCISLYDQMIKDKDLNMNCATVDGLMKFREENIEITGDLFITPITENEPISFISAFVKKFNVVIEDYVPVGFSNGEALYNYIDKGFYVFGKPQFALGKNENGGMIISTVSYTPSILLPVSILFLFNDSPYASSMVDLTSYKFIANNVKNNTNKYNVSFHPNNVNETNDNVVIKEYNFGEILSTYSEIAKTEVVKPLSTSNSFLVNGWHETRNDDTPICLDLRITEAKTYYAKWVSSKIDDFGAVIDSCYGNIFETPLYQKVNAVYVDSESKRFIFKDAILRKTTGTIAESLTYNAESTSPNEKEERFAYNASAIKEVKSEILNQNFNIIKESYYYAMPTKEPLEKTPLLTFDILFEGSDNVDVTKYRLVMEFREDGYINKKSLYSGKSNILELIEHLTVNSYINE